MRQTPKKIQASADLDRIFQSGITKTESCWLWSGAKNKLGYGSFSLHGKHFFAHRYSFFSANPDADQSFLVCHRCDNPSCVRPDHLFLGTDADNMKDMVLKGRWKNKVSLGSLNGAAKLSESQVLEIRKLKAQGLTYSKLAEMFSICHASAWNVVNKYWRHLA